MSTLYRVEAKNFATASENRIHADDVAKDYGFRGGLVPGVTTWAYLIHPVVEQLGVGWLTGGRMRATFSKPVYEGDTVEISCTDEGEVAATNEAGELVAAGTAALAPAPTYDVATYPVAPLPVERPDAAAELLAPGTVLGTLEIGFHADRHAQFLDEIDESLPAWRDTGVCHPGFLMRQANFVLAQNVRLGPWIHVESTVQTASHVVDGDRVTVRARVADEFERKGHRFVTLDILYVANDERPVLHVEHTAIWRLRPPSP